MRFLRKEKTEEALRVANILEEDVHRDVNVIMPPLDLIGQKPSKVDKTMGIEDIQISEELETNAPSIKYSGNEGPKSPQQMQEMMMAEIEEEYARYVFEMQEQGIEPMSLQQFMDQAMAEGQMSGGTPLPNDPTKPVNPFQPKPTGPVLPDRQMAAYGGIMGMDGRRQYGIGSFLKSL